MLLLEFYFLSTAIELSKENPPGIEKRELELDPEEGQIISAVDFSLEGMSEYTRRLTLSFYFWNTLEVSYNFLLQVQKCYS